MAITKELICFIILGACFLVASENNSIDYSNSNGNGTEVDELIFAHVVRRK